MTNKGYPTILIVDDDHHVLAALKRLLSDLPAIVLTAPDGRQALKILKQRPVSIIISDQKMPRMSGIEFLKAASEICPDSTRILITGCSEIDVAMMAIKWAGISKYFVKPWEDEILHDTISNFLAKHQYRNSVGQFKIQGNG